MTTAATTPMDALKTAAFKKFDLCKIEDLKSEAKNLMTNFEDGAGVAFVILLDYLEAKMTETEYVEFCDNL